jgi:hypothetical protein
MFDLCRARLLSESYGISMIRFGDRIREMEDASVEKEIRESFVGSLLRNVLWFVHYALSGTFLGLNKV